MSARFGRQPGSDCLRITQVSTADVAGGAERIAADLHRAYLRLGHDATLVVGFCFSDLPGTVLLPNDEMRGAWARAWGSLAPPIPPKPARLGTGARMARQAVKAIAEPVRALRLLRGYDDLDFPATARIPELTATPPDVLHLHNLHGGYFDVRALPALCDAAPVVLTAHDMWLATGHCAYSVTCERWRSGCSECPHLDYPPKACRDRTADNRALKKAVFASPSCRLHLAAPSAWSLSVMEDSIVSPAIVGSRVIPNGIDQSVFCPGDRAEARASLGVAADATVICFTVAGAGSPYKDLPTLAAALRRIATRWPISAGPLVSMVIGSAEPDLGQVPAGVTVIGVPFTPDASVVARCLQASDVYVHAALAEAFGLGIVEAQSVGLPAVVTRTGGAPEALVDGETGFVVDAGDAEAMSDAVVRLLTDVALRVQMGRAAASFALGRFSVERMAGRYLELYAEAIGARAAAGA